MIKVILREFINLLLGFKKRLMLVSQNKLSCLHIKKLAIPWISLDSY